jgi:glyoxalase superfamily protein
VTAQQRLGFTKQWEHRFEPGMPTFMSIARGRERLFLSVHRGDARPDTAAVPASPITSAKFDGGLARERRRTSRPNCEGVSQGMQSAALKPVRPCQTW